MSAVAGPRGRRAGAIVAFVLCSLSLAWLVGGQRAFGRIDAALALPWLMPGAQALAWLVRNEARPARWRVAAFALAILVLAQAALEAWMGDALDPRQWLVAAIGGGASLALALLLVARVRTWRALARWPCAALLVLAWLLAGQMVLAHAYDAAAAGAKPRLAVLTGLPLRWGGGGGDIAAMLSAGPEDAPALEALAARFDLQLVDDLSAVPGDEALLVAHPRALPPRDLVALDARRAAGAPTVILADALSTWPPRHPLGDPRNPPVTSLLTPLLDHWGILLAAPEQGQGDNVGLFVDPAGQKLLLHSAGRFARLPAGCRSYGRARVARCRFGGGATIWLAGDADLLHDSLWRGPLDALPWLRPSDNLVWLSDALGAAPAPMRLDPVWIR